LRCEYEDRPDDILRRQLFTVEDAGLAETAAAWRGVRPVGSFKDLAVFD
jgi:hypothetical protein